MSTQQRRDEIQKNLDKVRQEIESFNPTLIVVTKTYPISDVQILRELGVSDFGENRSSEGLEKSQAISANWHYQGEVQTKKVREILSWASTIHSIDQVKHLEKCEAIAAENSSEFNIFLQLSLDGNPQRGGAGELEIFEMAELASSLAHINPLGIMCVPPVNADLSSAYSELSEFHQRFKKHFPESPALSAGMSGDYLIALEHGATHIRVGSSILGARKYG